MHRNTYALIIALTLFAALVVGVNLTKSKTVAPPSPDKEVGLIPQVASQLQTYTNDTCGVQFQYPENIDKLENTSGAVFSDPESTTSAVIVTCQREIPRVPLPKDKMEMVPIGTFSATLYHDASQKDSTPIDKLIFTHPNLNLDVYIAGTGELFESIIHSLKIL